MRPAIQAYLRKVGGRHVEQGVGGLRERRELLLKGLRDSLGWAE